MAKRKIRPLSDKILCHTMYGCFMKTGYLCACLEHTLSCSKHFSQETFILDDINIFCCGVRMCTKPTQNLHHFLESLHQFL